jgi:hypothetical protein
MEFDRTGEAFSMATTRSCFTYHSITRGPRVTLCLDAPEFKIALTEGRAEIKEDDIWDRPWRIAEKYVSKD